MNDSSSQHAVPSSLSSSPGLSEGPYLADLLAQPASLAAAAEGLAALAEVPSLAAVLAPGRFKRVVLTGMGSSLHALYPLHLSLIDVGRESVWVESAELLLGYEPLKAADTLLVVVSQSGESAEVVQLLKGANAFGHVIGITNNAASTLGRSANTTLLMHAGPEATVSCKTYVATLAILGYLSALLNGQDMARFFESLADVRDGMAAYLGRWREHVSSLAAKVDGIDAAFVTGRGRSLATAGTGALILKESTKRPAEGMSCAAFRHGPLEMVGRRVLVIVFEGDANVAELNRRLYADILAAGGRAALVSSGAASSEAWRLPAVADSLRPLAEILPVQMLSLAIAARDGREAGRFEHASKITVID